jgi:hypothetical protein
MTINFKNDHDVLVYALEKIISHATKTQQIFVAQCARLLASIIGFEQGLINHIDNLQSQEERTIRQESVMLQDSQTTSVLENSACHIHPNRAPPVSSEQQVSPTPRDLQEESRIHLDRRNQVGNQDCNISNLDLSTTTIRSPVGVNIKNKQFLRESLNERKALKKQKEIYLLLHTRSGKVLKHPVTPGQRNHLQGIPKDTIEEYLEKRT